MTPVVAAASAALPFKPADDALPSGSQWGLAIVLCVAALAVAVLALRRRGGQAVWRRTGGTLQVLESRALSPQSQLVVVRYGERQLLLCVGPAGAQCLRDDPAGEERPS